jgi:hypothetical protein
LADEARASFDAALCATLDIPEPPAEGCWDWWLLPESRRSRVS